MKPHSSERSTVPEPLTGSGPDLGVARPQVAGTVERAADVLIHMAQAPNPTMGVTEIAKDLGLSKATVHQILASLRTRGLIDLNEHSHRYSLGPMSMSLGLSFLNRLDAVKVAGSELGRLSQDTHETATLSLRVGDMRMYVDQVTPTREAVISVSIGQPFPLHAGASSKAFLAFLPDDEIDVYLRKYLVGLTEATVTDPVALRREVREIRARGWAKSLGERQRGVASVAAPVLDHDEHPVAVVSVCGPVDRFSAEMDGCIESLLAATHRASRRMGHDAIWADFSDRRNTD